MEDERKEDEAIFSYPTYIIWVGKVGIIQAGILRSEHGIRSVQYAEY